MHSQIKKIIILILFFVPFIIIGQTSIKGNITTLAGIPNFGLETNLGKKTTFQVDIMASFWTVNGIPYKFGVLIPEFRYYPRESGNGFFVGAHIGGGTFKLQKWNQKGNYEEGYTILFGATLGYQFLINDRLNLELFLGGGSQQANYKGYSLETGERTDGATNYNKSGEFLPYRGGIMLVYKLNSKKK